MPKSSLMEQAITAFVIGFSFEKSRTHRYEHGTRDGMWFMRDAPRRNPRDYRKEEWIAYDIAPRRADEVARCHTRGRFFIGAILAQGQPDDELRAAYRELGYRLLATEPLFMHPLSRIPTFVGAADIVQLTTQEQADRLGKKTRTRPVAVEELNDAAPYRQYLAMLDGQLVGWVRSVAAGHFRWCSNMFVDAAHRRQGIGSTLLERMLREDRTSGASGSVLLSSRTGAWLYPKLGYEQLGTLFIYAPRKR